MKYDEQTSRKITNQAISIKTFKVCESSVRVNISIDCAHVHDQSNTTWLTKSTIHNMDRKIRAICGGSTVLQVTVPRDLHTKKDKHGS